MILGVDHIALSCADIETGRAAMTRAGYVARFTEANLPNPASKRAFLQHHESVHAIAFFEMHNALAVELTCHGTGISHAPACDAVYTPVLDEAPAGALFTGNEHLDVDARDCLSIVDAHVATFRWEPFGAPIWVHPGRVRGTPALLAVRGGAPLEREIDFWSALGLRVVLSRPQTALLELPSMLATARVHLLLTTGSACRSLLDQRGFPCLALWSSDITKDLVAARTRGASNSVEPFELTVAGRSLRIAIVRSPGGALVEFIQPTARRGMGAR